MYIVNISLAIPSVQDNEFVQKAGIEYENLKIELRLLSLRVFFKRWTEGTDRS